MKVTVLWRDQWLFRWPVPLPSEHFLASIESVDESQLSLLFSDFQADRELDDEGQLQFINEWDGAFVVNESCNVLAVTTLRDIKHLPNWSGNCKNIFTCTYKCKVTQLKLIIDLYIKTTIPLELRLLTRMHIFDAA